MLGIRNVIIHEAEVGLLYENGRFLRPLAPGGHLLVSLPWLKREVTRVDTRRTTLAIAGQEMLTADGISVRLNVAVDYRVVDPATAVHTVADYRAALYTAVQLFLREEVQGRTLDELLADRSALSVSLLERARPEALTLGIELAAVGVKDVILPGDVKRLLAKEMEAQREGRAALVAAREEVAATRARANAAQILQGNPALMRLRELDGLAKVSEGMGNTVVLAIPTEVMTALGAPRSDV